MARKLGLDATAGNIIRVAALLHDIGISGFSVVFEYKDLSEMNFA
jgi:HD superfamily phosphohydrolase